MRAIPASLSAVLLLLCLFNVKAVAGAKCKTKRVYWAKAGHNEDCKSACNRAGGRKPLKSGESLICATYASRGTGGSSDSLDEPPLATSWVSGAFRDIAKDPSAPQKQCWVARKVFESGEETDQPIAESSNFYCACWKDTTACKPWKPRWVRHPPQDMTTIGTETTCRNVCAGNFMVVVDRKPESFNYLCRPASDPSKVGWEHFVGDLGWTMCNFVQYAPAEDQEYNAKNEVYDCLCARK